MGHSWTIVLNTLSHTHTPITRCNEGDSFHTAYAQWCWFFAFTAHRAATMSYSTLFVILNWLKFWTHNYNLVANTTNYCTNKVFLILHGIKKTHSFCGNAASQLQQAPPRRLVQSIFCPNYLRQGRNPLSMTKTEYNAKRNRNRMWVYNDIRSASRCLFLSQFV